MDHLDFLRSSELFQGVTENQLKKIDELVEEIDFMPGEIIIRENERGDNIYLIQEGEVALVKFDANSDVPHHVATLKKNSILGEFELLENQARTISVMAVTRCHLLSISAKKLHELFDLENKKISSKFSRFIDSSDTGQSIHSIILDNVARSTGQRIRASNESIVEKLKLELAHDKERNAMARLIIMLITFLCFYLWIIQIALNFPDKITSLNYVILPYIFIFTAAIGWIIKKNGYHLGMYGLTLRDSMVSLKDSIFFTVILCGMCLVYKEILIYYSPQFFNRPLFDMSVSLPSDAVVIMMYLLFIPLQEFIVRGVLQGSFQEFIQTRYKIFWSIALSNLLFSVTHLYFSLTTTLVIFISGLFWGSLYARHKTLVGVTFSHVLVGIWALCIVGIT